LPPIVAQRRAAPGLADTRRAMSAFGGEADIENVQRHVRQ